MLLIVILHKQGKNDLCVFPPAYEWSLLHPVELITPKLLAPSQD